MKSTKNKLLVIMTVVLLCISNFTPVIALAESNNDPADALPAELKAYSDAYIEFSERLAEIGIMASVCIEDFAAGFENYSGISMEEYISEMVDQEITRESNQASMIWAVDENDDLYLKVGTDNMLALSDTSSRSISLGEWYDNIGLPGTTIIDNEPYYGKYNLLSKVKKGDVFRETAGGISGITGHAAIVEGRWYSTTYRTYYLRTIEANLNGVVCGILDDNRIDERGIIIYYVANATDAQIDAAVAFQTNQLGKGYNWNAINGLALSCNSSSAAFFWYCTELVWASYVNQGINFAGDNVTPRNIYYPAQLAYSTSLTIRSYS